MDKQIVRLAVDLTVNDGQAEEFRQVAQAMVDACNGEPGTTGYEFFFHADGKRCRLLETYVDADAVTAHFTGPVVTEMVPKMVPFCRIDRFEIYGDPGPQVTQMATGFGAEFFPYWTGIAR